MKCASCGGALKGTMTFCPFCGVRQDIDLRQVHFRDLGVNENMPCPGCCAPLDVIEFETTPALRIERCHSCHGMFFNPGELEALLDARTNPLVWLDPEQMNRISGDFGFDHEVVYRKCPVCAERMSHVNFAGRSGVILDRCGTHGVWLEGGELRRLMEWWRAGGKLLFQQHEADKARRLYQDPAVGRRDKMASKPADAQGNWNWGSGGGVFDAADLLSVAAEIVVSCITD
jgi:Zn-finger nucleic acid-binding protein